MCYDALVNENKGRQAERKNEKEIKTMSDTNKINDDVLESVSGGMLTEDEALAKALKHAGLKKDQVDFVKKVELDREHRTMVYEIKFYQGRFEYEYDVDAETGAILKFEKDRD